MSGFTESTLERKLAELKQSQESIQSLSVWLVDHRKHHNDIVKIWYEEFLKAQEHRKLTFLYLANDVIQNSRQKGGDFGKAFAPVLKNTFEHMAGLADEKTKNCIIRILKIWQDRAIYEVNLIRSFESSFRKAWNDLHGSLFQEELDAEEKMPAEMSSGEKGKEKSKEKDGKQKHSHSDSGKIPHKRSRSTNEKLETGLRKRNLKTTEDDLIQMVKDLDEMPSADAITRGKIAQLPPEVSDVDGVDLICVDSDESRILQKKVKSAAELLHDYNGKLDLELDERKRASMKLQNFIHLQKDLLTQAEHRLKQHQDRLKILSKKFEEMKAHVLSMPELPSVNDGLAPLPSARDLFNI